MHGAAVRPDAGPSRDANRSRDRPQSGGSCIRRERPLCLTRECCRPPDCTGGCVDRRMRTVAHQLCAIARHAAGVRPEPIADLHDPAVGGHLHDSHGAGPDRSRSGGSRPRARRRSRHGGRLRTAVDAVRERVLAGGGASVGEWNERASGVAALCRSRSLQDPRHRDRSRPRLHRGRPRRTTAGRRHQRSRR